MKASEKLAKANQINHLISESEGALQKIGTILGDLDGHRFTISVEKQGQYSYSFGSQKYGFKESLFGLIRNLQVTEGKRLADLTAQLEELLK